MVAIKNSVVLLASMATLGTAMPNFGQWHKPSGAPSGVSTDHPSHTADAGAGHPPGFARYSSVGTDQGHAHPSGTPYADNEDKKDEHGYGGQQNHPRNVDHDGPKAAPAHQELPENETVADIRFPHHGGGGLHTHEARAAIASRGMYECMNQGFILPCIYTPVKEGQCYNANYGSTGSMGPDKGLSCTLYERTNCNDHGWLKAGPFVWPGIKIYQSSHLLTVHGFPDTGPSSYRCNYTAEAKGT